MVYEFGNYLPEEIYIPEAESSSPRILVTDHDPTIPQLLESIFESVNYPYKVIDYAVSAEEGMRQFEKGRYDIVMTEWVTVGGEEFARQIKEKKPSTKIILFTIGDVDTDLPSDRKNFDICMVKPGSIEKIEDAFRQAYELLAA